jgi:hypothetical protein
MAKLFLKVIEKEKADGTYQHTSPIRRKWDVNKDAERAK